jgi:hypothetical protein
VIARIDRGQPAQELLQRLRLAAQVSEPWRLPMVPEISSGDSAMTRAAPLHGGVVAGAVVAVHRPATREGRMTLQDEISPGLACWPGLALRSASFGQPAVRIASSGKRTRRHDPQPPRTTNRDAQRSI